MTREDSTIVDKVEPHNVGEDVRNAAISEERHHIVDDVARALSLHPALNAHGDEKPPEVNAMEYISPGFSLWVVVFMFKGSLELLNVFLCVETVGSCAKQALGGSDGIIASPAKPLSAHGHTC